MPEKDEGLLLEVIREGVKYHTGFVLADASIQQILAKVTPIIDQKGYHNGFTEGREVGKVEAHIETEEAKKQEKERIREDILGGKPVGLTNNKGDMIFPAGYDIPMNSFIYFVSQEGLQALKGEPEHQKEIKNGS